MILPESRDDCSTHAMKDTPSPEVTTKQPENASGISEKGNTATRAQVLDVGANARKQKRSLEELHSEEHDQPEAKNRKATTCTREATASITYAHSGIRLKDLSDAAHQQASASSTCKQPLTIECDQPEMMNYESSDRPRRVPRPLPPILLETTNPKKLPATLRRFDPNTRIDIFNRKTGKILSGEDSIRIRDLPQALLLHAEYEPIVPFSPSLSQQGLTQREGRSAPNVRVCRSVIPLARRNTSTFKGKIVTVTKGPYRGYIGEYSS